MSLSETIAQVSERLDSKLLGLDEQKKKLNEIIRRWKETGEGKSCVMMGRRGSGKSHLTKKLIEKVIEDKSEEIGKHFIYVSQLGSDAAAQNSIGGDENIKRIVVIEDADELVTKQRQTLLYSFLNSAQCKPWLVILMVNRHDFVSNGLEKRLRSRLSVERIILPEAQLYSDFHNGLKTFLGCNNSKFNEDWKKFANEFCSRKEVQRELDYVFSVSRSFGLLKIAVAVFLGFLKDSKRPKEEAVTLWISAVATLTSSISPTITTLSCVSLRTFCVFLCVFRRLETAPQNASVSYRKVVVDYLNLCNNADTRMRVSDESIIFKELDYLVKLRVLFTDTKSNSIGYRRVSLQADSIVLAEGVKSRTIPSVIMEWFKTIPTV